jgi:phage tail-like protein
MRPIEFRRQIFRGAAQWQPPCGLGYTLRAVAGGGVALFSRPGFSGWATQDAAALDVRALAADECGRIFWIHPADCQLYRRDPVNGLVEPIIPLADCSYGPHELTRLLTARRHVWVLDRTSATVIAIRADTFQVIGVTAVPNAIDLAYGGGRLFSLASDGIRVHGPSGEILAGPFPLGLSGPVALGVDAAGTWLYVVDAGASSFLRFSAADGRFDAAFGNFDDAGGGFRPGQLIVHPDGNLFVSDGSGIAHEFAADGGHVGPMGELSPVQAIRGMSVDRHGEILIGSPAGIGRFSRDAGVAGNAGEFYTRTLDNGGDGSEGWQRVDLAAELDAGGAIALYYASDEDAALAAAVSGIFERPQPVRDKARALDALLADRWIGPHELRAPVPAGGGRTAQSDLVTPMTHSVAFRGDTRRYLWLKLVLSSLTPRAMAAVREIRVYYPRLSYLRYLPAFYQQDPVSRDFLERFLSMFETVFSGLEATVERVPEAFDPTRTPAEFLDWLAQWLDLAVEEDWPARVKRELVTKAASLYQQKGTPAGLASFIQIVTGTRPVIRESFVAEQPFVLGDGSLLGIDTRVSQTPMVDLRRDQRTVLGRDSILGTSALRNTTQMRSDPFRAAAFRFTVVLDMPLARFRRYERGLHRIIRESAPAHVSYEIRLVSGARPGPDAMLGVNVRLMDPPRVHLGYATLGESICAGEVTYGPQPDIGSPLPHPAEEPHLPPCSDGDQR